MAKRRRADCPPDLAHGMPLPPPLVYLRHLNGGPLQVATDCSGLESPLLALQHKLRVSCEQVFGCDNLQAAQRLSRTHFSPRRYYKDIMTRDNSTAEPCHLYIAGYPCQPFSPRGYAVDLKTLVLKSWYVGSTMWKRNALRWLSLRAQLASQIFSR